MSLERTASADDCTVNGFLEDLLSNLDSVERFDQLFAGCGDLLFTKISRRHRLPHHNMVSCLADS